MLGANMQMLEERAVRAEAQEAVLTPGGGHRAGLGLLGDQGGAYSMLPGILGPNHRSPTCGEELSLSVPLLWL